MQDGGRQPARSDYLDFELEIGIGRGREYSVAVLESPGGEVRATMHFPLVCLDKLTMSNTDRKE